MHKLNAHEVLLWPVVTISKNGEPAIFTYVVTHFPKKPEEQCVFTCSCWEAFKWVTGRERGAEPRRSRAWTALELAAEPSGLLSKL